ncbi:hypothetical protein BTN50_1148 [Candidatus Enterovibrio altilux]|uniref:Uncharacterized protein n=1 Tax=Candidatus Enterovibrio altilux TaxID=1927128 RepID=A0A291B9E9_9GAMM|nr:hypothetical protein BTN50_1148 [Candidatus Enterovibrio luxaltus]
MQCYPNLLKPIRRKIKISADDAYDTGRIKRAAPLRPPKKAIIKSKMIQVI